MYDYGENPNNNMPILLMTIVVLSSATANIFNKKLLTGTKVSLPQLALMVYTFALCSTFVIYIGENIKRYGNPFEVNLLTLDGLSNAEEIFSIVLFN